MPKNHIIHYTLFAVLISLASCAKPLPWPSSPLYDFDERDEAHSFSTDIDSIKQKLVGHYAHYDVVAYEDTTTQVPMFTFVISYGFTDFFLDSLGNLIQSDRFLFARHKINQSRIRSTFNPDAVQAIKPKTQQVDLSYNDGRWHLYRAPTPSLLGIKGDPSLPLSTNPNDPNLTDPDNDGNPGVTVQINIGSFIEGFIYITRREIYSNFMTLNSDGTITGYVKDDSEQFVVGASMKMLAQESNNIQHPDKGLNPIILVPVGDDIDTLEELMEIRDEIFPKEPEFKDK
jgi:hypothetical protein